MAEPLSLGHDQQCGTCGGRRTVLKEKLLIIEGEPMSMTVPEICPTCGGAGRVGGQAR